MAKPRKKKMGRPLEEIPLRKLIKSIRQDIDYKLSEVPQSEGSIGRKSQNKKG